MLNKFKRFLLIVFILFIINDICSYIRQFNINALDANSYSLFYTILSNGSRVYNTSVIYFISISIITFIRYFLKSDD